MNHQNKKSHPTGFKSPSKVSLMRSKSTDHLTSAHKSINRKNILQKTGSIDVSATKPTNLTKTKSAKSLKAKPKSLVKSSQTKSAKKLKPKVKKNSESDTKTVKKGKKLIFKQQNEEQSFASSQQSFNPVQPLEYFFYQNTYIPIQNSAQRRFVFRIREVDQRIESKTADSFFLNNRKKVQSIDMQTDVMEEQQEIKKPQIKIELKDNSVETQKPQIVEFGTSMTPRTNDAICIQTEAIRFAQDTTKCFSTTLNDLQFLFLPEESNFQNFSRAERLHYKQLFESIAMKIWTQGQNLQELTPQRVQILLYQRQCIQMGMLEYYPQQGFPTHIFAVMSYLTNLFAFVEMNDRSQTLQRLHSIYGFGYQQRLNRVIKGATTKKRCSTIMSQDMFMSLENQLFKQHTFPSQLIEQSVHIHNRAIFDAANQELQKFKPFFYSRGEPFPWSVNVGMTFFSIDEETLPLLFKQIKQKVLMKFGSLCGLLVDYDEFKQLPGKQKHPVHIKKIEQHETKMINEQMTEQKYQPEIQQAETLLRVDLSKWILASLIDEMCDQLRVIEE